MPDPNKKPLPGDPGYLGGTYKTTVYENGVVKEVTTIKDAYGNIVLVTVRDKLFGIF